MGDNVPFASWVNEYIYLASLMIFSRRSESGLEKLAELKLNEYDPKPSELIMNRLNAA